MLYRECSFCNATTSWPVIDIGWGEIRAHRKHWSLTITLRHCPKHAKEYIDALYKLAAIESMFETIEFIDGLKNA